jgi:hypothetical protein
MDMRSWILALLCVGPVAGQQLTMSRFAARCPTPTRDAGTYHVATGTWTRTSGAGANLGPDVIYRADFPSGYFGTGWEGAEGVDEGVIPGPGSPLSGPQDAYRVDGFRFAYCSYSGAPIDWKFRFYDSYVACDVPDAPANCMHQAGPTLIFSGFPSGSACWSVTVDLSGGAEFCMQADGGPCAPGYQGVLTGLDGFGWGAVWNTQDGALAGPLLVGALTGWAPEGEGTCYLPSMTCHEGAAGLGTQDLFAVGAPLAGCFWFSSPPGRPCHKAQVNPSIQFDMTLYTDCGIACQGTDCEDERWCSPAALNTTGAPGRMTLDTCTIALPVVGADQLPPGEFAYLLVGNGNGVIVQPPGSVGDLCLGGSTPGIGRYSADLMAVDASGQVETDLWRGNTGGGSGQLPNPPGGQLSAGETWNYQYWYRDGGSSNFTDAVRVTWNL